MFPRKKFFLSETTGINPANWWSHTEVGHTHEALREMHALFGRDAAFPTAKPERLLERILHIATNPGDLVLDPFLGSGTTTAVAHKMKRYWIGIEQGDHCESHCLSRMLKVCRGTDQGGISEKMNWTGGGGFSFYRESF